MTPIAWAERSKLETHPRTGAAQFVEVRETVHEYIIPKNTHIEQGQFRAHGFSVAISLLNEKKEPPKHNRPSAKLAGWSMYSIPIEEGNVPSLHQVCEFVELLRILPEGTKVLVHCKSGLGRSAFMGAVYWIAKGLTTNDAIAQVQRASLTQEWNTPRREKLLRKYEEVQKRAGTKSG
jgi:protein tyrosine phosphatase (PTP) superfamily phosphohydrolase (DUF442 family)